MIFAAFAKCWSQATRGGGFGGFSRLSLATHDYVYRPLLYWPLTLASRVRVRLRRRQRRRWELQRAQRGESGKAEAQKAGEKEKEADEPLGEPTAPR